MKLPTSMKEAWEIYFKEVLPATESLGTDRQLHLAFYGGAIIWWQMTVEAVTDGEKIVALVKELVEFHKSLEEEADNKLRDMIADGRVQ